MRGTRSSDGASTQSARVGLSPIREMAVGAPAGTISLGLGEPGWALPAAARAALSQVGAACGPMPYGPNTSSVELVEAIVNRHGDDHDLQGLTAEHVMLTSGSQAALCALFLTHVEAGSTVLVPDPGFVSYPSLARLAQAHPATYALGPGGRLDAALVIAALTAHERVSLLVINHPANPTGAVADADQLRAVAAACAERGVLLVSDEVYGELWLGARPASLHDVVGPEGGVVLGSVSKAYGAPGLRVGWAVGDPQVLTAARMVHNAMTTAPSRPSQAAATALLQDADTVLPAARQEIEARWLALAATAPRLLDRADQAAGRAHGDPRAGFYLWLPVPDDIPAVDTAAFALRVRDTSLVTTIPGTAFGPAGDGYLRVSLGGPIDELRQGLGRLAPWWEA
ncbi:MAG: pyridoxal phosphate-dependent aminotransferase [Ornithinimicrobium sp.]|uniref:pyridoxal phosphate-dependent aminotransferase n=1 Tax=Ornithinimicrobium sp. TaxID=1977084 RepID=UPI0026DF165E|nr:pyridoxal phosphate-dependent aminotransferase [Ornithinimicrobium sp.]MDO5741028.1 pyridoxal phosphate-dependent aminotransferase [Ornithinimicrobium sp.]